MKRPGSEKTNEKLNLGVAMEDLAGKMKNSDLNNWFIFGSIALVLVMGIFALFHPADQTTRRGNPACGKIVVAADGATMTSNVAASIDGAQYFLVINPLSSKLLEAVKNPFFTTQLPTSNVAYFVAGKGEEAVIAGDIDPLCYQILSQFGVRAYGGYTGRVKDVVDLYRQAAITPGMRPQINPVPMQQTPGPAAPVALAQSFVSCPNCKWRVYAASVNGQYPVCPNCGTVISPTGGFDQLPQNQMDVQSPVASGLQPNAAGVPGYVPSTQAAPPIFSNATMPHAYRGVCSNCHQISPAPANPGTSANTGAIQRVAWANRMCPVR